MMTTRSFSNLELFEFDKLDCVIAPIAHQFLNFAIAYPKKLALIAYQLIVFAITSHPPKSNCDRLSN